MAILKSIETTNFIGQYDDETQILRITYRNEVNPETTQEAYKWIFSLIDEVEAKNVRGSIIDFRQVKKFAEQNLTVARTQSKKLNRNIDLSNVPTALLVSNFYQEEMVNVSMRLSVRQERIRILKTDEAALKFIAEWHKHRSKPETQESEASSSS